MLVPEYSLTELCEAADVSTRTVRYYISQGLLASPERRGPGATYRSEHLDRLRLIRKLKERHLPLSKIRSMLDRMSDEDIRDGRVPDLAPDTDSAYHYVSQVLNQQENVAYSKPPEPDPAKSTRSTAENLVMRRIRSLEKTYPDLVRTIQSMARQVDPGSKQAAAPPAKSSSPTRSTWEHHTINDNIELHVRRPLSRDDDRRVRELLDQAFTLFSREEK